MSLTPSTSPRSTTISASASALRSKTSRHCRMMSGDRIFIIDPRTAVCSGGSISVMGLGLRHAPGFRISDMPMPPVVVKRR